MKEIKFFDAQDDITYPKKELVLEPAEKYFEKEKGNFEQDMKRLDLNEQEDSFDQNQSVWIGGDQPSQKDFKAFERFQGLEITAKKHPNMFAWFQLVSLFTNEIMQSWK